MPRVSVVIPNYNHARFLKKRIDSVLNQTFRDIEVIFLDDASTDNSSEVFNGYSRDPRIRAIFNDVNGGSPFKQWNVGFREAKSEYVWIAESDDIADERFLETMVNKLDANPGVGLAYCNSYVIDENGENKGVFATTNRLIGNDTRYSADFINNGKDECARFLVIANTIPNASAVLIRRSLVEQIGLAEESAMIAGDWLFWAQILQISDIAYVAEPLNQWRTHAATAREQRQNQATAIAEGYKTAGRIAEMVGGDPEALRRSREIWFRHWGGMSRKYHYNLAENLLVYREAAQFDPAVKARIFQGLIEIIKDWAIRRMRSRTPE